VKVIDGCQVVDGQRVEVLADSGERRVDGARRTRAAIQSVHLI
jgi:hypothetical protein